ncbi:hypothetical protein [Paenibacillus cymbidii]|uniref:hypothetical protein n=1 Tax=Paenibacillus cymbidii TaxID=1639034 RepID=UPI001081CC26|nr:hypothetical protein [Paenibacillus cymbidii]
MNSISEKSKQFIYELFGFRLQLQSGVSYSYDNLSNAITFGEVAKKICDTLDIDSTLLFKNAIRSAFQKLSEEAIDLSEAELTIASKYAEETLLEDTTFEDVLTRGFLSDSPQEKQDLINTFKIYFRKKNGDRLYDVESKGDDTQWEIEERRIEKLVNEVYEKNKIIVAKDQAYLKKGTALTRFYLEACINYKKPIKTPAGRIVIADFKPLVGNLQEYGQILKEVLEDEPTSDLLYFEKETNLFFLIKAYFDLRELGELATDKKFIKYYSAFSIIGDIELRNLFLTRYIEEARLENNSYYKSNFTSQIGLCRIFQILYIFIPFLSEFIKEQAIIHFKAQPENVTITDSKELEEFLKVKKKLYLYYLVSEGCNNSSGEIWPVSDVLTLSASISNNSSTHSLESINTFLGLYKATYGLRASRRKNQIDFAQKIMSDFERLKVYELQDKTQLLDIVALNSVDAFLAQLATGTVVDDALENKYDDFEGFEDEEFYRLQEKASKRKEKSKRKSSI